MAIKHFLKKINIDSKFIIDSSALPKKDAIAGAIVSDLFGHFISIIDIDIKDSKFIIGDPMFGRSKVPIERLKKLTNFTGFYLQLQPK